VRDNSKTILDSDGYAVVPDQFRFSDGSNVMYRLPGKVVARIGRPGSKDKAGREVLVPEHRQANPADLGKSDTSSKAAQETRHRIACLRGELPRPWTWTAF
jgi:hypothetical protein